MKYLILSFLFTCLFYITGCSSKSAEDYMNAAKDNIKQKNIAEAINNFESVVHSFPDSPQAPDALFQIATLYQNKMVKNISDIESYKKAEEIFRQVYNTYPKDKKAPMALFLSGFILANDLRNFQGATTTYNLFLEKYPQHELASSAKEELSNMGLSPDQILQKKNQKNI